MSRAAVGGDHHGIWKETANILNKQRRQPIGGGPQGRGFDVELTNLHGRNSVLQNLLERLRNFIYFLNDLGEI